MKKIKRYLFRFAVMKGEIYNNQNLKENKPQKMSHIRISRLF